MASDRYDHNGRKLLFPIGALIFSTGVHHLMREGRLDPIPYFQRHTRGDWGNVVNEVWDENNEALESDQGNELYSAYQVTRDINICIITNADRSETRILLASEY